MFKRDHERIFRDLVPATSPMSAQQWRTKYRGKRRIRFLDEIPVLNILLVINYRAYGPIGENIMKDNENKVRTHIGIYNLPRNAAHPDDKVLKIFTPISFLLFKFLEHCGGKDILRIQFYGPFQIQDRWFF
jgi:hypothetical protein